MPNDKKPRHRERESSSRPAKKGSRGDVPRGPRPFSTARPESPYSSRPRPRTDTPPPPAEKKSDYREKPRPVRAYDNRPPGSVGARPPRPAQDRPSRDGARESGRERPSATRSSARPSTGRPFAARPASSRASSPRPAAARPRPEGTAAPVRERRAESPRLDTRAEPRAPREANGVSEQPRAPRLRVARPERAEGERPRTRKSPEDFSSFTLKGPGAVIARRASDRLRGGHVWVYASDIEQVQIPEADNKLGPTLLPVVDGRGIPLGTALYSAASQIALRLVTDDLLTNHDQWLALLTQRLHEAFARRQALSVTNADTNAQRLVFSEGDSLPGLIVDKYDELIIVQLLAQGLDRQDTRDTIVKVLREAFKPETIVERPDPRIRELEQLAAPSLEPLYARDAEQPLLQTQFKMNGLLFHYDSSAGQKTGAFLDQSRNYAAAEHYAHGEALDVCTYQGGFALHLARKCSKVTGVDVSHAALEVAERNLEANKGKVTGEVDWVEANAFDLLRDWADSGRRFDTIVLDPPAFAKTKRAAENAVRGYKEMTLRALKMLRPGGILVTCSCSHHVSLAEFTQVTISAAVDAKRRVQLLERRGASPDHPHVLSIPETEYLKCLICRVED